LRVRTRRGGCAVLVTGPGEPAEKLDGRSHVALVKLLAELPVGTTGLEALRERPPRLPFYVAAGLEEDSAAELTARLTEIGFVASVEPRPGLRRWEVRSKVWRMGARYLGLSMGVSWLVWHQATWLAGFPEAALPALGLLLAVPFAAPMFAFTRPLMRIKEAPGAGDPAQERLAATLTGLGRRADRRLVARILDRLALAERLGAGEAAVLLAERAVLAAQGLASLEEGTGAQLDEGELQRAVAAGGGAVAAAGALDRLRETERLRGVIVADLLRTFSRLDLLCLKLARAEGLAGAASAAAVTAEVEDLRTELAAEEDLAALLGTAP
jgi:hypothetical protein